MSKSDLKRFQENLQDEVASASLVAGLRQILFGLAAAGVTFGIGKLISSQIRG
jgi:hypothetical protein